MEHSQAELRKLSSQDGQEIYDMLQKLPEMENGFNNTFYGLDFASFQEELARCEKESQGIGLQPGRVPQTIFWYYVEGRPVGLIKVRHVLTDSLRVQGGNIGYAIIPEERGKGLGSKMLQLALAEAKKLGLEKVLLTCEVGNHASRKVAVNNGGEFEKEQNGLFYYWIKTTQQ